MTKLINLYGAPGSGKSTTAARLYSDLKTAGKTVELVREFIKERCWAGGPPPAWYDDAFIFGSQLKREAELYGKVDYIVTDAPLGIAAFFGQNRAPGTSKSTIAGAFEGYIAARQHLGVQTYDYFLLRDTDYESAGRWHTQEESDALAYELMAFLAHYVDNMVIAKRTTCYQHARERLFGAADGVRRAPNTPSGP